MLVWNSLTHHNQPPASVFAIEMFLDIQPYTRHSACNSSVVSQTSLGFLSESPRSPSTAPRHYKQEICKCPVDTFGGICSRALRARMTGRALFMACLSNCMQPPMSPWLRPWTDLTRSWRKLCNALRVACLQRPSARSAYPNGRTMPMPAVVREAQGSSGSVNGHLLVGGWPRQSFER